MTSSLTANATDRVIKVGNPAPFSGVLVPEKTYRTYVENEFELHLLRTDVAVLSKQVEGMRQEKIENNFRRPNVWNWFLTGVIVGAAVGFSSAK